MGTTVMKASIASGGAGFAATRWSVVLAARNRAADPEGYSALEALCQAYWKPLYAYVRRRGNSPHDAEDLTQAFFARLLEKDYLRAVDRSKGKFRSFLLKALEHFLANEWRNARCQKRGGHCQFVSIDELTEQALAQPGSAGVSPEQFFEQQWATTLLGSVLGKLQQEFAHAGKAELFQRIKCFLTGEKGVSLYAELATDLGMTEAALKMTVSRTRRRYLEVLRDEIRQTVSRPEEVEEELRALRSVLESRHWKPPFTPSGEPFIPNEGGKWMLPAAVFRSEQEWKALEGAKLPKKNSTAWQERQGLKHHENIGTK
jgi:RNA polymerase sigma factor (sigma-70 family)